MKLTKWDPFWDLDLDNLFRRSFRPGYFPFRRNGDEGEVIEWRPAADISETDKEYLIKADLPEVRKEDVEVSLHDGFITIKGQRKMEKEEKEEKFHRIESMYGAFSRTFTLPDDVDAEKIKADSKDGVLRVHLPKTKSEKAKAVQIAIR